jgi:hypothetical protein
MAGLRHKLRHKCCKIRLSSRVTGQKSGQVTVGGYEVAVAGAMPGRDRMKKVNALYRKGDAAGLAALGLNLENLQAKLKDAYSWMQQPYSSRCGCDE